ncbi:MAG: recombinase family protein [Pseudomonadota bacterium]
MSAPDTFILKALIYCRVSTKNQETDGHGLESQETRCRQHAAAKGYEVQDVYRDTVSGGADVAKRPGVAALLSSIDAQSDNRFVVIVDDLKRVSRDTRAVLDLRDALRLRDVRLECPTMDLGETPEDTLIETILAARQKWEDALKQKEEAK